MASRQNFQTLSHPVLGRGIDQHSTFNNIKPGFSTSIVNMDTGDQGFIKKRTGYEGFFGDVPLRIFDIEENGNGTATLILDTEVNLLQSPSTPIVLWGDPLQTGTGTLASSGTTLTGTGTLFTSELSVNSLVRAAGEERRVVSITSDTSLVLDEPFYPDLSGEAFTYRTLIEFYFPEFVNESKVVLDANAPSAVTVNFAHNSGELLSPVMVVQSTSATLLDNTKVFPSSVAYQDNNLDALIEFDTTELDTNTDIFITSENTDFTATIVTYSASLLTVATGIVSFTIPAGTHSLPNLNTIYRIAYQDPTDVTQYLDVLPDEFIIKDNGDIQIDISIDPSMQIGGTFEGRLRVFDLGGIYAQESSFVAGIDKQITFTGVASQFNFTAFYLRESGATEQKQVFPDVVSYDDAADELVFTFTLDVSGTLRAVYMPGLVRSNRLTVDLTNYPNLSDDTLPQTIMWGILNEDVIYRESAAGGGELTGIDEYSSASTNHIVTTGGGLLYKETEGEITLASTFVELRRRIATAKTIGPFFSNDVDQTRSLTATNITENKLPVTTITNNKDETATIALNIQGKVGDLTDLTVLFDTFTITSTEQDAYAGQWSITAIDDVLNTLTVSMPGLPTYVADEINTGAMGGIFTDVVVMSPTDDAGNTKDLPFVSGDIINSTLFEVLFPVVSAIDGVNLWLTDLAETVSMPSGARLSATRTSNIIPLESTTDIVRGDMIALSGYSRKLRVLAVTVGESITVDESLQVEDSSFSRTVVTVPGRWITVESPTYNDRRYIYWDSLPSSAQDRINSARINDSVFFSNYSDPILKYDGNSLYRAGLPAWQPQTTSWVDGTETGIVIPKISYINIDLTGGIGEQKMYFSTLPDFTDVSTVYAEETDTNYNITLVNEADRYIVLEEDLALLSNRGQISLPQEVAYYFKLQAVDKNNNVVASAVSDFEECIVQITKSGAINHRLTGLPKFDIYDYDRIDVYTFRTKVTASAGAPFYQVRRDPISYRYAEGEDVIVINDTIPDEALSPIPDDQVSIALKGAELPLSSEEPPRSKYMTSASNKLVLGNIKSWSKIDLDLLSNGGITELNTMDGMSLEVGDGTHSVTVDCVPLLNRAGTSYDVLNTTDMSEISTVTYPDATTVRITLSGTLAGGVIAGDYIQLGSWFTDLDAAGIYAAAGRSRDDTLGGLIGWWQINSYTEAANDIIDLFYVHGRTGADDWTFGAAEAPLYLAHSTGNLPCVMLPYALTSTGRVVEDIVFDDRKNQFEFTNAINRGLKDIRSALNQWTVRQSDPWLLPKAGATEGSGKLILRGVRPGQTITGKVTIDAASDLQIFWDQRRTPSAVSAAGFERLFPSRLLISVANYPEMFDNPFALSGLYGDSIIDVNANDGQEITGMSTFFASSTTSGSNLEETLVVFKDKSIYAVNLSTRQAQKIESGDQGCSIPGSISITKDGIMFANSSGIYMVTKNLDIVYVGTWMEDYWKDNINFTDVASRAIAVNDASDRKYKLSVPTTSSRNDTAVVFNYISAATLGGGWTTYDNFGASGWAQTTEGTYFSSYSGRVFRLRDTGNDTDYRDDNVAISSSFTYAPQAFGDTGSRAVLNRVITHIDGTVTSLEPSVATDLSDIFQSVDIINIDTVGGESVASSLPVRHALYFQIAYSHNTKDEALKIGGIDFKVTGLDELGITQANE